MSDQLDPMINASAARAGVDTGAFRAFVRSSIQTNAGWKNEFSGSMAQQNLDGAAQMFKQKGGGEQAYTVMTGNTDTSTYKNWLSKTTNAVGTTPEQTAPWYEQALKNISSGGGMMDKSKTVETPTVDAMQTQSTTSSTTDDWATFIARVKHPAFLGVVFVTIVVFIFAMYGLSGVKNG